MSAVEHSRIEGFQLDFTDRRGGDFASDTLFQIHGSARICVDIYKSWGGASWKDWFGDGEIDPHARTNGFAITGSLRAAPPEEENPHRCFNLCKCGIGESPRCLRFLKIR